MNKMPRRIAAATISASLLLSCCFVVPTAVATTNATPSNDLPRATIEAGDLGSTGISYTRDQDGIDAGGTYAIFYNTTRSLLYHTGTGNTDQVTGTVSGDKLTLASGFDAPRQLWTVEEIEGDDSGYYIKSTDSNRYLDLSQTTNANGNVKTSDQPVRVDITFHEDTGTYSLSNGSNYLTHGSTAGNKYYCSTSQDTALTQFQLYLETEVAPTVVGENPKGTEAVDVPFSSEATGSRHFRIPSLYTLDNGWIVAAADIRWTTSGDSPQNLDTIVSVSKDNGQTWEWEVVNYLADMADTSTGNASSSFIDPSIVQDRNGTVHMVVDACPSYVGLMSGNQMGQESTGFDDQGRLLVAKGEAGTYAPKTASSYTYYVDLNNNNGLAVLGSDDGTDVELYPICSQDGTATDTWVDAWLNVYEKSDQDDTFTKLYVEQLGNTSNRVQKNLFFQKSEWKVYPVFYIMHRTAQVTEDGLVWSAPQFLDIKAADNEKFTGVCPGRGITMTYNGNERIIFPLYDNRTGNELASVIYSDDGGATWHRGEHNANLNNVGKTSESQIVTLPNGDLRMYSRNTINYVSYSDSSDGGVTWSQCRPDQALFSQKQGGGCMVSFINLDGTLIGPDDQEYDNLILGSYARIQRTEGIVRIGSADENGTVTWLNEDVTRYDENNYFAYSCVSQLQENGKATDTFGILYENQGSPCQIKYETLTVQDLLGEGWYMVQDKSEKVTLSLDAQFLNLTVGQSSQVQATVVPQDGATVTWNSDDPTVATVDSTGLVSGVAAGTTTITATATTPGGIVRTAHLDVAVQGETGVNLPQRFQTTITQEEHEAQTTYDLDTDGIDSGSVYAIFHAGAQRTLYHANNATNTDQVTGTVSNDQLTLDGQYAASRQLWRITKTENGYTIQSMEADGKYLSLNDTATSPGSKIPVQADPFYLEIQAGETSGTYTISHTVDGQTLYLSHSNTASQQHNVSVDACEFQLFRENTVPAHTTYQVSLSGLQALVDFVDTLDAQAYSVDTWATLQAARQAAVDFIAADNSLVFDNEAAAQSHLEQITGLTEDLYEAWLHLAPPECQHTYGTPEFHWSKDYEQATATFTCTQEGCNHQEVIPATVSSEVTTTPTCTEKGATTYTATVEFDQKTYTDIQVVENLDALGHTTELRNAKEATCTEDGYTGDLICSRCGETIQKGEMIPATGHHYVDGVCDVCGQEDPNFVPPTQEPEQGVVVDNQTDEQITVGNAQEVFEDHTVITVENIEDGELYEIVEKALENVADMEHVAILDINATLDGQEVQPRGALQMTIEIPDNLSADHLKLYCVAEDGTKSEVPITVDKDTNTVTANLAHMDTYVLANVLVEQSESHVPPTGDSASLALYTMTLMGAAVCLLSFVTLTVRKRRS